MLSNLASNLKQISVQIVVVPVPRIREETGEMIQLIPQGRISDPVVEQINDCPVLETRLQQRTDEQTDDMPVHADLQGSRRRDVPRHGRGEEAPVPQIREHCVEVMMTIAETDVEDQPGVLIHGSENERQRHRSQQQQAVQGDKAEEKGRKGERGKREEQEEERKVTGEETKMEKGRGVEEEKDKEVERNVMDWTMVTRSAKQKRRTIQIFVKWDGSRTITMEMALSDKVSDIVKRILTSACCSKSDVYVKCEKEAKS